jgi:hypothetical protein
MPAPPDVYDLAFDDVNMDKLASHGVTPVRALEILENNHTVARNRKTGSAPWLLVGLDYQGQCIAMPIMPTHDPGLWRPITGWFCKPSEWALLSQRGNG